MTPRTRVERLVYQGVSTAVLCLPSLAYLSGYVELLPGAAVGFTMLGLALWFCMSDALRPMARLLSFALAAMALAALVSSGTEELVRDGTALALLLLSVSLQLASGPRPRWPRLAKAATLLPALLAMSALLMRVLTQRESLHFLRAEWEMTPAAAVLALLAVVALGLLMGGGLSASVLLRGKRPLQVVLVLVGLLSVPVFFVAGINYLLTRSSPTDVALPALVLMSVLAYALILFLVGALVTIQRESAALAKSQEWFRRAWDDSGIGMAMVSREGKWLSINAQMTRIVGYTEQELQALTFQDISHPDDLALDLGELQQVLDGRSHGYEIRKRYFHKAGHIVWVQLNVGTLRDERGEVECFLSQVQDISHQVQAETDLAAAMETLEDRIAERTRELKAANAELEAFAQSVSHDLRAPLRALDGFSRLLLESKASQIDDEGRHYLARIRAGSQRMGELIDGLLQLSRITRESFSPVKVDLAEIARQVVEDLRAAEPGREVEFTCPATLPVRGDAALLRSVMTNVIGNAWKFSARQPVARIDLAGERRKGMLRCRVSDNGSGFDAAYQHQLFQPFQRLHTVAEAPGFGLGLATVRRIVSRHGGECSISGVRSEGAVFLMDLPVDSRGLSRAPDRID